MSSKKTRHLVQQQVGDTLDLPAELAEGAASERALIVASSPFLAPPAAPEALAIVYPTRHTHCRCLSCQRRRARRRAARMGAAGQRVQPYIDAVIVSEVEEVAPVSADKPAAGAAHSTAPTAPPPLEVYQSTPVAHPAKVDSPLPGRSVRQARGRSRRSRIPLLLATVFLLCCACALAWYSGIGSALFALSSPPQATITVIPRAVARQATISITAVTGRASASQVAARWLSVAQTTPAALARATGSGQTAASPSQGTLYFYNGGPTTQTIPAQTALTGTDGITVVTSAPLTLPAGNPPNSYGTGLVQAQSVQTGSQANIAAGDIGGLCCASGVSVKNGSFAGAADAQSFPVLKQSDIDSAAHSLSQGLLQKGQHLIEGQVPANQQLAAPPQCSLVVHTADAAGSHVAQTSISVSLTCSGEAFDRAAAQRLATSLFTQQGSQQLGAHYRLVSRIRTAISRVGVSDAQLGTLAILVQTQGTWAYQFGPDERLQLAHRIEGKSIEDALTLLAGEPGVQHLSIQVSAGAVSIPVDASRITFVILPFQPPQAG